MFATSWQLGLVLLGTLACGLNPIGTAPNQVFHHCWWQVFFLGGGGRACTKHILLQRCQGLLLVTSFLSGTEAFTCCAGMALIQQQHTLSGSCLSFTLLLACCWRAAGVLLGVDDFLTIRENGNCMHHVSTGLGVSQQAEWFSFIVTPQAMPFATA